MTTKIKVYVEKNAVGAPVGLFEQTTKAIIMCGRTLATRDGVSVVLADGVRVVLGGLAVATEFVGNARIVANPAAMSTALVIEDVDEKLARCLVDKYPSYVYLPNSVSPGLQKKALQ